MVVEVSLTVLDRQLTVACPSPPGMSLLAYTLRGWILGKVRQNLSLGNSVTRVAIRLLPAGLNSSKGRYLRLDLSDEPPTIFHPERLAQSSSDPAIHPGHVPVLYLSQKLSFRI
jgi:hypothetical protein